MIGAPYDNMRPVTNGPDSSNERVNFIDRAPDPKRPRNDSITRMKDSNYVPLPGNTNIHRTYTYKPAIFQN